MIDFKVSLNKIKFNRKPTNAEAAELSTFLPGSTISVNKDNFEPFVRVVGELGCTFCPATFDKPVKDKTSFSQTQLLALDFDNKDPGNSISFDAAKKRAEKYGLPMLFAYDTHSSTNHDKFRVAFLNDGPVPKAELAEAMLKGLLTIFPEADPQGKSAVQMYFGGKEVLHLDPTMPTINVESLFRNAALYLKDRYGNHNYGRKVAELSRSTGIRLNDKNRFDISIVNNDAEVTGTLSSDNMPVDDNFSPKSSIVTIVGTGEKLSRSYRIVFGENSTKPLGEKKPPKNHLPYRKGVLGDIRSCCQLYREFETGDRRLSHPERFGLATNLVHVETGASTFKEIQRSLSYYDDRHEKYSAWDYYLHYIKDYKPYSCDGYCPHISRCSHGTNLLSTAKVKYHQWERIVGYNEPLFSLAEATKDFQQTLLRVLKSTAKLWHIIKAQTALGKTEAILELLRDTQQRILVVVPTNKLKREIRRRAKKMGIEMTVSPSLREYEDVLPDNVWDEIETRYDSGRQVVPYLKAVIKENDEDCSALFSTFLKELDEFRNCDGHAITTHRRFQPYTTVGYEGKMS